MPRITCVKCAIEMRPKKNDVTCVVTFGGVDNLNNRTPYQVYSADLWECPKCEFQVVSGFGNEPILEHWQDDFKEKLEKELSNGPTYYAHER